MICRGTYALAREKASLCFFRSLSRCRESHPPVHKLWDKCGRPCTLCLRDIFMSHSAVHPMDEERASEMLPYAKKTKDVSGSRREGSGCKLLSVKLKTEFPASAPAWRKTSPEGRESRHAGRATPSIYGNAAVQWRTTACHDGNLKCSVIRGIVRLPTTKPTIMTEQDKITIFDAIINPFLCHTPSPGAQRIASK